MTLQYTPQALAMRAGLSIRRSMKPTAVLLGLLLAGCGSPQPYRGGGMAAYDIKPAVYQYHHEHGFTGVDAMGWDPLAQRAWSRLGAAKTCGIGYEEQAMLEQLIARFGHDRLVHQMNGIDFHHLQSRKLEGFCTEARKAELRAALAEMAQGRF